jgi:hypothetical protein
VYLQYQVHPGEHDTITVNIDTTGLASGPHNCDVVISSDGGAGIFTVYLIVMTEPGIDIEKTVWNVTSQQWQDAIRVPVGTDILFRIIVTNIGETDLHCLTITDNMSRQLEYRNNANYTPFSEESREVKWFFDELSIDESIEIQYHAETVHKCYGYNYVNVTTLESAYDEDSVDVKVPVTGQPVMDICIQVWDETLQQWTDHITCILESQLKFRVFLNSTALNIIDDVTITDSLPVHLNYCNDATLHPDQYSQNQLIWHFDSVEPGQTQEIIYHAEAISEGKYDGVVDVTTSTKYYDMDSVLISVVDFPDVQLVYPNGGETLSDVVTVQWSATDASSPILKIYVYLSDDNGVTWNRIAQIFEDISEYHWDTTKVPDGRYVLKVVVEDRDHLLAFDTTDIFTIANAPQQNNPPIKPERPSGPSQGKPDVEKSFTSSTIDPDEDQVFYFWDWGDGTNSGWLGPYNSGEICAASHTWDEKGTYEIKVKAKDSSDKESDWSDPLPITMSKNKAINPFLLLLERLMERFPILGQILQPIYDKLINI